MGIETIQGILLPFFGTSLGAACVFVMRGALLHGGVARLDGICGRIYCNDAGAGCKIM